MQKKFTQLYPIIFIFIFFGVSLFQLNVANLSLASIPEKFLWKKSLIKNMNNFRFTIGDSVFSQAILGKADWIYFTGDQSIEDYQRTLKVNPRELEQGIKALAKIDKQTTQSGGKFFLIIVPDKNTVYPQYMPNEIPVLGKATRTDQILQRMREKNLDIEIIDLRPILIAASAAQQVYQKTDTHWNCLGAYYAYQAVMQRIAQTLPQTQPLPLTAFNIQTTPPQTRDISRMMGFQYRESGWQLTPKIEREKITGSAEKMKKNQKIRVAQNSRTDLPTALVFHDSFYTVCFKEFFEPHFSRTYTITASLRGAYRELFYQLPQTKKPDIVIIETAERFLPQVLNYLSRK